MKPSSCGPKHQTCAMLLFLTLALLAGPACRAQKILGNNVGTYFYVHGDEHGEIKTIRIFLTIAKHIKGIQLKFDNHWSDIYGSHSLVHKESHLEDGEHIVKVHGEVGMCLHSLTFTTNKGRQLFFGVTGGRPIDDNGGPNKHLVTVNGVYSPGICVTGMGFKWRQDSGEVVPANPPREPETTPSTSEERDHDNDKDKDKDLSDKDKDKDQDDEDEDDDDDEDDEDDQR